MKKFILNFIVFVLLAIAATGCLSITRVDDKDKKATESEMVVTPTTIVNLRTGPGTNYQIVTGLQPGMLLIPIAILYLQGACRRRLRRAGRSGRRTCRHIFRLAIVKK